VKLMVIGLGSMGRRRCRNLLSLGYDDILGFDIRKDRRIGAEKLAGITSEFNLTGVDAVIISTPPDMHKQYVEVCLEAGIPCFMESNTFDWGINEVEEKAEKANVLVAPSCTLRYYSLVQKMKEILVKKELGEPWAFTAHCGQYLDQWHPWEKISDFYMSTEKYGGVWEMMQYELVYLTCLFGYPLHVDGNKDWVSDLKIVDPHIATLIMKFVEGRQVFGTLTADVISKKFIRECKIMCSKGVMIWDASDDQEGTLKIFDDDGVLARTIWADEKKIERGYNPVIKEEPYEKELKAFIDAVEGKSKYPYDLADERKRLSIMEVLR